MVWFWVSDKNLDFQKYNLDNEIKFQIFVMSLDQILNIKITYFLSI